jgi:hypothetical protein
MPPEPALAQVREFLFGVFDGVRREDKRAWRRFWKRIVGLEPGEMAVADMRFPRSGPYHRRHMKIEASVFDAQDRFDDFEQFRIWLKVGAGWVTWCAGPKGGVVPIPKSISYAEADQEEFTRYHEAVMAFLRGQHAAPFLWRHMNDPHSMMESILEGFHE